MFFAVIVAAGKGERMNVAVPKQYLPLFDKPIIAHTIEAFERSPLIQEIVVVIHPDHEDIFVKRVLKQFCFKKFRKYVFGGDTRQESVYRGLEVLRERKKDFVFIHDGVRPFVTESIIERCAERVQETEAVCCAIPCVDTVKFSEDGNTIEKTLDRKKIWRAQTPQVFRVSLILEAMEKAFQDGFYGTDDSSLVERLGKKVALVLGAENNIKITTPFDFIRAEEILRWEKRIC